MVGNSGMGNGESGDISFIPPIGLDIKSFDPLLQVFVQKSLQ